MKIFILVLFVSGIISCDYSHDGKVVIDAKGNVYKLEQRLGQLYLITLIDKAELEAVFKLVPPPQKKRISY